MDDRDRGPGPLRLSCSTSTTLSESRSFFLFKNEDLLTVSCCESHSTCLSAIETTHGQTRDLLNLLGFSLHHFMYQSDEIKVVSISSLWLLTHKIDIPSR